MIISLDLSQIEVICFAFCTKDKTLCKLLKEGLDVHKYLASIIHNKSQEEVTTEERKAIKAVTFGIIYGNGALKLSETLRISQDLAKEYIAMFYEQFPGAKTYHDRIIKEVTGKTQIEMPGRNGTTWNKTIYQQGTGRLKTLSGRVLYFKKFPAKYTWQNKNEEYYNPPDIKNWPIQSLARDIYGLILAGLYRSYIKQTDGFKENIKLINTIHDSIMFDVHPNYTEKCLKFLKEILDKVPEMIYIKYQVKWDLPLNYSISIGDNWFELKEINLNEETKNGSTSHNNSN